MPDPLTHLGRTSALTEQQLRNPRTILESFPNPQPARDYQIEFVFPEFTSVCPVTGQPDFATITVRYVPDRLCVEMKSLKLYFYAYRDKGIFYESVVNTILDDLLAVLKPRFMRVVGAFNVRGGTAGTVTAEHHARRNPPKTGKTRKTGKRSDASHNGRSSGHHGARRSE